MLHKQFLLRPTFSSSITLTQIYNITITILNTNYLHSRESYSIKTLNIQISSVLNWSVVIEFKGHLFQSIGRFYTRFLSVSKQLNVFLN